MEMEDSVKSNVWHHGLMAEKWAEFNLDTPELAYFQEQIERYGEPVLDLGCGTGRLLVPLLKSGVDIEGCDVSADMLNHCRQKAAAAGYEPTLYNQPMDGLDLPRRYRLIYICGSFGLAGSREKDIETLIRCYEHLNDGGVLIFNVDAEYNITDAWPVWLKENRGALPEPWSEEPEIQHASGNEYRTWFRRVDLNPLEQSFTSQVRIEKWRDGRLVTQEEQTLTGFMYFKNEVVLMLQLAGFDDIAIYGDYSDQEAAADSREMIFVAQK